MNSVISRRSFLKGSGAGLALAVCLTPLGVKIVNASQPGSAMPQAYQLGLLIKISPDDMVTVLVPQTELGQGTSTGIPMIVAEELEADWSKVRFELAPAAREFGLPGLGLQLTGGSRSIRLRYSQLRQAGATARQMLLQAAAKQFKAPLEQCVAQKGALLHKPSGRSLSFGQVCQPASRLPVPPEAPLKERSRFGLVGRPTPRLDLAAKVAGQTRFGVDLNMEGMIHAVLARPPAYGAKAVSFNRQAVEKMPGVRGVKALEQGIAICADSLWNAQQAKAALKVKWSPGSKPTLDSREVEQALQGGLRQSGLATGQRGEVDPALAGAARRVQADYLLPYLAHVVPEPLNCTALYTGTECQVWVPTQFQTRAWQTVASMTKLSQDKVRIHTTMAGGGFGRRLELDVVIEAVALALRYKGKPVKVVWSREDDLRHDVYRPGSAGRIQAGLDAQGKLVAWKHRVVVTSIMARFWPAAMQGAIDRASVEGAVDMPYAVDNFAVEYVDPKLPIPAGFWRSVGHSHNFFMVECFVDHLARSLGRDPLEYRLSLLTGRERHVRVLELAASQAGWAKPLPRGRARGLALGACYGSYVAHVAEVSRDPQSQAIRIERLVCAIDCGQVINPDSVKAQMQGAAVMALSTAIKEKVAFAAGGVHSSNFHDYPLLRFDETPPIEVHIVQSHQEPGGVGEVGIPTVAPALANAVASLIGKPVGSLPLAARLAGKRGK